MIESDVTELLTVCAVYDNRDVSLMATLAWHKILEPYDLADAIAAVTAHYERTDDWIMPMHILTGIKRIRARRIDAAGDPPPDADPSKPLDYLAALRAKRFAVASEDLPKRPVEALIAGSQVGVMDAVDYNGPQASQRRKQAAMLAIESGKDERGERERLARERAAEHRAKRAEAEAELEALRNQESA